MTKVNLESIGKILVPEQPRTDSTCYGRVDSINDDGSFQVQLNASATKTRCANLCGAAVNDRVLVLIQANGHCAAIGRVGGSMGAIPAVLYDNPSGSTGNITLSDSAANYGHMRVFVKDNNDYRTSIDILEPDGKLFSALLPYPDASSFWLNGTVWSISGTSITVSRSGNVEIMSHWIGTTNLIAITRVEAW